MSIGSMDFMITYDTTQAVYEQLRYCNFLAYDVGVWNRELSHVVKMA